MAHAAARLPRPVPQVEALHGVQVRRAVLPTHPEDGAAHRHRGQAETLNPKPDHSPTVEAAYERKDVCKCVCVCMGVCVHVCMYAYVHMCVCMCMCVWFMYACRSVRVDMDRYMYEIFCTIVRI